MRVDLEKSVSLKQLEAELVAVLTRDVSLSARQPSERQVGYLAVLDSHTGDPIELSKADEAKVKKAVADHVPSVPELERSPIELLDVELDSVQGIEGLKAALKRFTSKSAEDVNAKREKTRTGRSRQR